MLGLTNIVTIRIPKMASLSCGRGNASEKVLFIGLANAMGYNLQVEII
jgi:hypothetical protein